MRLIAQAKQGFYPAPPEAIAGILRHLKIPDPPPDPWIKREDVNILDPCAGEAKALVQVAVGLGVSWGHVFAVELNAMRAALIAEHHPEVKLLGPCSFEGTRITRHSFSLVYLNPPFDDEIGGGGREETSFLRHAVDLLVPGGILVLVCPITQVFGKREMCGLLDTWFDQIELYLFPDQCREYNECVVFGRRRKSALTDQLIYDEGILTNRGIRRCSDAPIAQLARLGEPQFDQWDYAEPDVSTRRPELDAWELPLSVKASRGDPGTPDRHQLRDGENPRRARVLSQRPLQSGELDRAAQGRGQSADDTSGYPGQQLGLHGDGVVGLEP